MNFYVFPFGKLVSITENSWIAMDNGLRGDGKWKN